MLGTVKEYINSLDDTSFDDYYQQYVATMQEHIVSQELDKVYRQDFNESSINSILSGINSLVDHLNSTILKEVTR